MYQLPRNVGVHGCAGVCVWFVTFLGDEWPFLRAGIIKKPRRPIFKNLGETNHDL